MTIGQRLRAIDRRAGFHKQPTPEQWVRIAQSWRSLLFTACFMAALVVLFGYFVGPGMSPFAFLAVFIAFQAGQQKVEYDRLRGKADS